MNTTEIKELIKQKANKAEHDFNEKLEETVRLWYSTSDEIINRLENERKEMSSLLQEQSSKSDGILTEAITSLTSQYVGSTETVKEFIKDELTPIPKLVEAQNESIAKMEKEILSSVNRMGETNRKDLNEMLSNLQQLVQNSTEEMNRVIRKDHSTVLASIDQVSIQMQDKVNELSKIIMNSNQKQDQLIDLYKEESLSNKQKNKRMTILYWFQFVVIVGGLMFIMFQ
ncbi:hypothetical protein ACOI1C_21365 [Bacillus sp. DJP31]|uniref:hypothetical protein n=1 Tax=Bacillus sp. DJP31 TaxID=3409789 RepID=UPI003BB5F3ED